MSAVGMVYFLMAVSMGDAAPAMTTMATFDDPAACSTAAAALEKTVEAGTASVRFACFPATALDSLGDARLQ